MTFHFSAEEEAELQELLLGNFQCQAGGIFQCQAGIMHAGEIISKLCKFSEFSASPQFIRSIVVHGSRVRKCFNLFWMKDKK